MKLVERDGLAYEGDSETPFTGVSVEKYENGQKAMEWPYKDRELYGGPWTRWREDGQKEGELVNKSGKTLSETRCYETEWYETWQKESE